MAHLDITMRDRRIQQALAELEAAAEYLREFEKWSSKDHCLQSVLRKIVKAGGKVMEAQQYNKRLPKGLR